MNSPNHAKNFDPLALCPKCGYDDISSAYHKSGCTHARCTRCHDAYECEGGSSQHIVRTCRRCHFVWFESPLDVVAEAAFS